MRHISEFIPPGGRVLDLGCGTGAISLMLKNMGCEVASADIADKNLTDQVVPVIYDGRKLPWPDNHFDAVLLLTVLHHTTDPESVLREACRVGGRIIVLEDVYANRAQKHLTFLLDSLFNLEFRGHPHTNKTDREWRRCFAGMNLALQGAVARRVMLVCSQMAYCLDKDRQSRFTIPLNPPADPRPSLSFSSAWGGTTVPPG